MTNRRKFPPLKLDLASMRKTLALLKAGKLLTPYKKSRKGWGAPSLSPTI